MSVQLHNELKKEFQLERLILFSDAVFAIAITLLVIEIKIPELHEDVSDAAILHSLKHLIPKFVGFIISFGIIGTYWTIHHRLFGFVINFDKKLLLLNLLFLFFIVLMPFSTGLYGEYAGPELMRKQLKVPMTFYVLNIFFVGLINYFLWSHISNSSKKLCEPTSDPAIFKMARIRSLIVPLVFLLMLTVAYLFRVEAAVYVPLLIPVTMKIIQKKINRKKIQNQVHYKNEEISPDSI